jgi:hypothetical protein
MFVEQESMVEVEKTGTVPTGVAQYLAMPVESILSHSAANPSTKPVAIYDPEVGDSNADQKWTKKTAEGQHEQDKTLLLEYLPAMTMYSRSGWGLPTQDEMTSGLQIMMETNNGIKCCPMYAIFATKLFLGVHEVLRVGHIRPFEELQATLRRCVSIIDRWFKFSSKNEPFENWPARRDDSLRQMRSFAQELIEKLNVRTPAHLQPEPSLFFKRNPTLCGLLTLNLNMLLQVSGQSLVGTWGSAIYPIHLYNACQQSGGLDRQWEDAEYLYQLHTPQRIFVGAAPTTPQDYHKCILLMFDASAQNFAPNRRQGGKQELIPSKKGPKGLTSTSPVRDIFQPRSVGDKHAILNRGNINAMMSVARKAQRTSPPLVDIDQLMREMDSQQELSPVQLLTCVREGVAAEELHLLFDYFGVHERGITLLRQVRTAFHDDLVGAFDDPNFDDEARLPYVVASIFEIVARGDKAGKLGEYFGHDGKILNRASAVVRAFLDREDAGKHGLVQARAPTRAVQYARRTVAWGMCRSGTRRGRPGIKTRIASDILDLLSNETKL